MKQIIRTYFNCILFLCAFMGSCSKDPKPVTDNSNSSGNLTSGRSGIVFNSNNNFGGSTTFRVINTTSTMATTQAVGSLKRYMVLKAEESYGGLGDTRKATIYITVPVPTTVPVTIDLSTPLTNVPSAQVELYETIGGGSFGNTCRSISGQLQITKLTDLEIEGIFSGTIFSSTSSGYTVTNGTFAGKF